ncbi:MAG: metalloprotease [Acidobacteria bacterium]|nr:MAG: metalloprotease [Acidobacteriota bacterium]
MFRIFKCFMILMFLICFVQYASTAPKKGPKLGFVPKGISLNSPGSSKFLTGPQKGKPADIALGFLKQNKGRLKVIDQDIDALKVTDQYSDAQSGATHIYLRQAFAGIEVFNANANVSIAKDGSIINAHGSLISGLARTINNRVPAISAIEAAQTAAQYLELNITEPLVTISGRTGPAEETVLSSGGISIEPIRTKLIYQPVSEQSVRLSWNVEIYEKGAQHNWSLRVDAENKQILSAIDLVENDSWKPAVGNVSRRSGSVISAPSSSSSPSSPVTSSYNVFARPKENPDDGPRTIENDPFDVTASPFGWHDTDGVAGPEFTITRGNNVYAYTDIDANNVPDANSSPDGGASLNFDFPLDLTKNPDTYRPAAVTNLFYWNNIMHDVFYHYGFNEAAGNFQVNNYGNGGLGGDDVQAEAQDGSSLNNANFGTPVDGMQPRMQMFVWVPSGGYVVTVNAGTIAGDYTATPAVFGAQLSSSGPVTGDVELVTDSGTTGSPTDACEPLVGFTPGHIALLDRGTCTFVVKVKNAQNAGAAGVIVANNQPGNPITMGGTDPTITIAAEMVSRDNGTLFKANLPFNATLKFAGEPVPSRDSDLDAGVICHEYTHGISNRLTGGPANVSCLQNAEEMGEGWSDFSALVLTPNSTDGPYTSRGIGNYVDFEPSTGTGIRPTPYTIDLNVNPSTYADISGQEVHTVGYIWTSMLWEVYWNLVAKYNFNPNIYQSWTTGGNNLAIQLEIDGMKLQPCSPGFVDGRDAILLADQNLTGGANQCAIWQGFAKRGLGFSASQGSSNDTTDGTEAFDLPTSCFNFTGFGSPLKPEPQLTSATAGAAVRVKFSLNGNQGLNILASGFPGSRQVTCDTLAPTGSLEPTTTSGGAGLDYDPSIDQYNYPWATLKSWKGQCRQFVISFTDGSVHSAYVRFK